MRRGILAVVALALVACQRGPFPDGLTPQDPGEKRKPVGPLPESPSGRALVAGETRFASALYRQVAASPGSVVVSPYGVFATLGMLREGAAGATAAELDDKLGLGGGAADGWPWLYAGLTSAPTLRSASAVWLERKMPAAEDFVRRLEERHQARRETFDATKPSATAADVNAWASRHTEGRISKVLSPSDLSPDLRLILTNAVYFHDRWEHEFPRGATREEDFHAAPDVTKRVPMMHLKESFWLQTVGPARVLALPHKGGATELLLVLPSEGHTLAEVESALASGDTLAAWSAHAGSAEVLLSLPRFRVESQHDLVPPVSALGMGSAFGSQADLGPIGIRDPLGPLFVSDFRQRALLECDEQGTTAAAVTSMGYSCAGPAALPQVFRCDQPFLFVLRHVPTGTILFVGRYAG